VEADVEGADGLEVSVSLSIENPNPPKQVTWVYNVSGEPERYRVDATFKSIRYRVDYTLSDNADCDFREYTEYDASGNFTVKCPLYGFCKVIKLRASIEMKYDYNRYLGGVFVDSGETTLSGSILYLDVYGLPPGIL